MGWEVVGERKDTCCLSPVCYKVKFIWKLLRVGLILARMGVLSAEQVSFLPPTKFLHRKLKSSLLQITAYCFPGKLFVVTIVEVGIEHFLAYTFS